MSWNVIYGLLILTSTIITWASANLLKVGESISVKKQKYNRIILLGCLVINLGILFLFKYSNFIINSINNVSGIFNFGMDVPNLDLLLPVGISFYTFQAIGYTVDVYRGTIKPEKNMITYALFVSFFPQLVAGPIERAKNLLPQFNRKHFFNAEKAILGVEMMVWGYFMKLCVADRVSLYSDAVFNNLSQHNGASILMASFLFSIQIYCDFCGYSLIAIGVAKLLGFDLMENFRRPYFASNLKDFWKRWHISLSTWFMDYVYIPLGGNRCSIHRSVMNLFITFLVSGMWHGANWTFLIWGAYHGLFVALYTLKKRYLPTYNYFPFVTKIVNTIITFIVVLFGWIFFRANSVTDALEAIAKIFFDRGPLFIDPVTIGYSFLSVFILFSREFMIETNSQLLKSKKLPYLFKSIGVACFVGIIILFGIFDGGQFIYFQF